MFSFILFEISALKQCKWDQNVTQWKWFAIKGFTLQAVLCSFPKVTSGLLAGSSGSCAGGLEIADGPAICSTCSLAASGLLQFIALLNKICFELSSIWNYWHTNPFFFFNSIRDVVRKESASFCCIGLAKEYSSVI